MFRTIDPASLDQQVGMALAVLRLAKWDRLELAH
jgi:hypothetical protein